jgi:uncharacterized protein (DUF488 family)
MVYPFYTIGHGTRSIGEFIELLLSVEVALVADVRTVPRSRTNPQFNREAMPTSLAASGIRYQHIAPLGGRRGRQRGVPADVNAFWQNESFHNYADYAMGDGFRAGLSHLRELGGERRCAVMCAETLWWRCHRRIITDYLLAAGEVVFHVLGTEKIERAVMNEAARTEPSGGLVYPGEPGARLLF